MSRGRDGLETKCPFTLIITVLLWKESLLKTKYFLRKGFAFGIPDSGSSRMRKEALFAKRCGKRHLYVLVPLQFQLWAFCCLFTRKNLPLMVRINFYLMISIQKGCSTYMSYRIYRIDDQIPESL